MVALRPILVSFTALLPASALATAASGPKHRSNSTSDATVCFWANGTAADAGHLRPCQTSLGGDGVFACCPPQGAKDLCPLDYPLCTADGLCKAGNSDFTARGGCTDGSWASPSCPKYCPFKAGKDKGKGKGKAKAKEDGGQEEKSKEKAKAKAKKADDGGMAGLTDCGGRGPWFCCNTDHDDGACECSPPRGLAFMLNGTSPIFFSPSAAGDTGSQNRSKSSSSSSSSSFSSSTVSTPTGSSAALPPSAAADGDSGSSDGGVSALASTVTVTATPAISTAARSSSAVLGPTPTSNPATLNAVGGGSLALAVVAAGFFLL